MFFVFLEERDINVEQNYIFNHVFNKSGLRNLIELILAG